MDLSSRRYTTTAFPPYRFVPGRFPHPTADPRGHSYLSPGSPHPSIRYFPPEEWRLSHDYLFGCDLYNHGYWWEAHESWEGLWRLTDKNSAQGRFLQGLIQISACHLKLFMTQRAGVMRLLASGTEYLAQALAAVTDGGVYMGLAVEVFLADVRAYYALRVDEENMRPHDPERYPYIRLRDV